MVDRLVLGCGDLCLSLVRTLRDWPGRLFVIDRDEQRVEHLRDLSVNAETGTITERSVLESVGFDPEVVVILTDDREQAAETAVVARAVFPKAQLLSLPGRTGTSDRTPDAVDTVLSPGAMVLDAVDELASTGTYDRATELGTTLDGLEGTLTICTHDNPDPDALGSALALKAIADRFEVPAEICYFGDITHQENRAFVNLLEVDLRRLEDPADLDGDHFALVDHSHPGINNQLPADLAVDIVIDHHPSADAPVADFVDVRSSVGATSTLFVEYLEALDIDYAQEVATGLLYGIRVDTRNFGRETTPADFEAAATLLPRADLDVLARIESPSVSPHTLETVGRAIRNRRVEGSVLTSCVGPVNARDSLAQAADRLLGLEDISVTVVYGYTDETIYLSGRARGGTVDLGEVFRRAFSEIGSAGGHDTMAGAQISLGIFEKVDSTSADEALQSIVAEQVESRLDATLDREDTG